MKISIRAARGGGVPALVQLRMANAERHAGPGPSGCRLPQAGAVRRYFEERLGQAAEAGFRAAGRRGGGEHGSRARLLTGIVAEGLRDPGAEPGAPPFWNLRPCPSPGGPGRTGGERPPTPVTQRD